MDEVKNYIKEGQKLPLYGVGPYIVYGMAAVTVAGIILFSYVLKTGILGSPWILIFRIVGAVIIALGIVIWVIGAMGSDMENNIAQNRLKTNGIYAWARNPMYTGWWFVITGISLMWHNIWLLLLIPVNWAIMTITLKRTEATLLMLTGSSLLVGKK